MSSTLVESAQYTCDVCGKCFGRSRHLTDHKRSHIEKKYECEVCNMKFRHLWRKQSHMINIHERKPFAYPCSYCDLKFNKKGTRNSHEIMKHTKKYPYTCKICNKGLTTAFAYSKHKQRGHLKMEKCAFCDKMMARLFIPKHVADFHSNKAEVFICDVCGKTVNSMARLMQHKQVHSLVKNFHCNNCGKSFATNQSLKVHAIIHNNDKLFRCKVCNKGFVNIGSRNMHLKRHERDQFPCDKCQNLYMSKAALVRHIAKLHPE